MKGENHSINCQISQKEGKIMEELRKVRKRKIAKGNAALEDFEDKFKKILIGKDDGDSDMYYFQCLKCNYSLFSSNNSVSDKQKLKVHVQKFHEEIGSATKKVKTKEPNGMKYF